MKLKFVQINEQKVNVVATEGKDEHIVGEIFTPSGSSHDKPDSIQVCGFTKAHEYWGCGIFGQITGIKKEKLKSPAGEFEIVTKSFKQVRDIQLQFDIKTIPHTVENVSAKCLKCFNKPCTCEVKENGKNPYTVKHLKRK